MELNEIEKVLKKKATQELKTIVEDFTKEIAVLCKKYHHGADYTWLKLPLEKDSYGKFDAENIRLFQLRRKLEYTLNHAFLDEMIKEKSKELVEKLDIL